MQGKQQADINTNLNMLILTTEKEAYHGKCG